MSQPHGIKKTAAGNKVMYRSDEAIEWNSGVSYAAAKSAANANVDETGRVNEEMHEEIQNVSLQQNGSSKETNRNFLLSKILFVAGMVIVIFVITVVIITLVVIMLNLKPMNKNAVMVNKSLETITNSIITTSKAPVNFITSCNMLPKSSPSAYYWIVSSNGSTIRAYCDMQKTCGNITGGWMRVTSLDMSHPSSKCPSSFCLSTTSPRTCQRCRNNAAYPKETYDVGVTYSHVCGRVIAYQVGKTTGYSSSFERKFDGVSLFVRKPKVSIWSFVAASQVNYKSTRNVCPCINPNDKNITLPPPYIRSNYFCDTATYVAQPGVFYNKNPLWDGHECMGTNMCCSFNSPPWFHRILPQPTAEAIVMKIGMKKDPRIKDVGIEVVDIYVH